MDKKNLQTDFQKRVKKLKKNEPFLVTFTVYSKDKKAGKELETFLFINNFPYEEIPGTRDEINRLLKDVK